MILSSFVPVWLENHVIVEVVTDSWSMFLHETDLFIVLHVGLVVHAGTGRRGKVAPVVAVFDLTHVQCEPRFRASTFVQGTGYKVRLSSTLKQ